MGPLFHLPLTFFLWADLYERVVDNSTQLPPKLKLQSNQPIVEHSSHMLKVKSLLNRIGANHSDMQSAFFSLESNGESRKM